MEEEKLTEKPSYYAIIPANVRYDKRLSPNAKLLYGEISCLLNFNNKCFASNKYFARLYDVTDIQISRLIKQLIDADHIFTENSITNKGTQRLIKTAINLNVNTPINQNVKTGINKNVKHNKQRNNSTSLFKDKEDMCFISFWDLYDKKVGKKESEKLWSKLSSKQIEKVFEILPKWLKQFESKKFTPDPENFLSKERWNDEIIISPIKKSTTGVESRIEM